MTAEELITKLKTAKYPTDIFPDYKDWSKLYRDYAKLVHPDVCMLDGAHEAFSKLNSFKLIYGDGMSVTDGVGTTQYTPLKSVLVSNNPTMVQQSYDNYRWLMAFKDDSSVHFQKYLPETGKILPTGELVFTFYRRCVPIANMEWPVKQEYVNFILSRMLEFCGWINQCGYVHAGLNPDNVWIIPEDHGMVCTSFYHMVKLDKLLKTISGKYASLYDNLASSTQKHASSDIDTTLAKRTAIWLLGDKTGIGNSLKRTHNPEVIQFLQSTHYSPLQCYKEYREVLKRNFDTKVFHVLNI